MQDSLELHIYPLGKVSHAAVDTADNGAGFPRLLVHLGGAVELGNASELVEASLEVCAFIPRERFLVGFD